MFCCVATLKNRRKTNKIHNDEGSRIILVERCANQNLILLNFVYNKSDKIYGPGLEADKAPVNRIKLITLTL